MQITIANFFRVTKPKLVIFVLLVGYFALALLWNQSRNDLGYFFFPAIVFIYEIAKFFELGTFAREGKGPETPFGHTALGWGIAGLFALAVLYCIACALGIWYESVQRRVHTNAGKK